MFWEMTTNSNKINGLRCSTRRARQIKFQLSEGTPQTDNPCPCPCLPNQSEGKLRSAGINFW